MVAQALVAHVALVVAHVALVVAHVALVVAHVACSGIVVDFQDYALLMVKLVQHDLEFRSNFFVP